MKKLAPIDNKLLPIKQSSQGPPPKELKRDDGKVEDIKPEGESVKNEPET